MLFTNLGENRQTNFDSRVLFYMAQLAYWASEDLLITLSNQNGFNNTIDNDVERADSSIAREIGEGVDDGSGPKVEDVSRNKVAVGVEASGVVHSGWRNPGCGHLGNLLVNIQDDIAGAVGDDWSNLIHSNCRKRKKWTLQITVLL